MPSHQAPISNPKPAMPAIDWQEHDGGRVLIVDDMPANVRLLAGILRVAESIEVHSANNEILPVMFYCKFPHKVSIAVG